MEIKIENCKIGYILKGLANHKNNGHYIIFIEHYNGEDFIGAMISSTDCKGKNILMKESHFETKFEDGSDCMLGFKNSHLVKAKLCKNLSMGPFELYGILSNLGIEFVIENIENTDLQTWEDYLNNSLL